MKKKIYVKKQELSIVFASILFILNSACGKRTKQGWENKLMMCKILVYFRSFFSYIFDSKAAYQNALFVCMTYLHKNVYSFISKFLTHVSPAESFGCVFIVQLLKGLVMQCEMLLIILSLQLVCYRLDVYFVCGGMSFQKWNSFDIII